MGMNERHQHLNPITMPQFDIRNEYDSIGNNLKKGLKRCTCTYLSVDFKAYNLQ